MSTPKQKFPVLTYAIRGCSLSKRERISLVRRAMAGTLDASAPMKTAKLSSKMLKGK